MSSSIKKACTLLTFVQLCTHVFAFRMNAEKQLDALDGKVETWRRTLANKSSIPGTCVHDVLGAEARDSENYPSCKCGYDKSVFCGYRKVALRKFDSSSIQHHPACRETETPYCAVDKERPPLQTILREDPCREWSLFSITNMVATRSIFPTWRSYDMRATAVVTPGELKYKGFPVSGKGSGNPELHFIIPSDALTVKVKVSPSDFTVVFDVQSMIAKPMTVQHRGGGGVTAELVRGPQMEERLQHLNDAGIYLKDPFHFMFDEAETGSNKTKARHFYQNWLAYRRAGFVEEEIPSTGMWKRLANGCFDNCRLSPIGTNETKVIGYGFAVRAMKQMGPKLQCYNLFRRNEFGVNILNEWWWPEKPNHAIGLADSLLDHAFNRKWIDRLIGPALAEKQETLDFIVAQATKYWTVGGFERLSGHAERITEQKMWTTVVLHKLLVFVDISEEDATIFLKHKENVVVAMMLPRWIGEWHGGGTEALKWKAQRAEIYRKSLADKIGEDFTSLPERNQKKLVAGMMDALMFAGGVSVPTVLKSCFAILYGKYGQDQIANQFGADWHLDESYLDAFVHETIRRFPAVGGFLAWDRYTGSKTNVDLRGSNADLSEEGWGEHARDFWMRDVAEYEQKSISWGDFAMVNGDNAHPGSRACPAKRASFLMIREFIRAFLKSGGVKCWSPKNPEDVKISGQGGAEFTLIFDKHAEGC